jgi:flagellin
MSLRINTNLDSIDIHGKMLDTAKNVSQSLQRLSSGLRINSAKDDTAGFAVANKFKSQVSSMRVAYQNASEGQSLLAVADGAYNKVHDILVRMKDLATQAASSPTSRTPIVSEFQLLQSEIDRIAGSTKYNTTDLVKEDNTAITFQVGQTNGSTADFQMAVSLMSAKTSDLGVSTSAATVDTDVHAQSAMAKLDIALASVNSYMGKVGAYQNRLQYTMENLTSSIQNYSASESTIRDVDMADEVTKFTKNQILQQSSMAMMAQANSAPNQILSLLRG